MSLACPVGHPSADGMKSCPICGRKYVPADLVVLPPSKDEVLAEWRARRRAAKAAEAAAAGAETIVPAARESEEDLEPPGRFVELAPKLLTVGAAAVFTGAFVLGESVALTLLA